MLKKTKIVATIGPSCWDKDVLLNMISSGMNVARINASFADVPELERVSKLIRSLSDEVAIMLDTKGHKIRINDIGADPIMIEDNHEFILGSGKETERTKIYASYANLAQDVTPGTKILVDDGKIELSVLEVKDLDIVCKVVKGGLLKRLKTVNIPNAHLSFPALTEKDYNDIEYAVKNGFDFVSASFVRNTDDVKAVRDLLGNSLTKLIAKIENPEGVSNFDSILERVDGIMIARGDLGVELPAEQVPILQKQFIRKCNEMGKPVIVATQMLESMTASPSPTRAEVNDVANAIFDGADAVMLSGETSTGKYPVDAVKVMTKVAREVEPVITPLLKMPDMMDSKPATNAIAKAVAQICDALPIDKVLVATATGTTAITLSRFRLKQPIYAFTKDKIYNRRLAMHRGVEASVLEDAATTRDLGVKVVAKDALTAGFVSDSDLVVVVAGANIMGQGATNMLEIQRVGELVK